MDTQPIDKQPGQLKGPWRAFVQYAFLFAATYYIAKGFFSVEQTKAFNLALGVTAVIFVVMMIVKMILKKKAK